MRLDGNSILIADADFTYGAQLKEALSFQGASCFVASDITEAKSMLEKYGFDVVISNYYLADGIIHELIDWCADHLDELPIFTCVGHPLPYEANLSQKHSIAEIFHKKDPERIIKGLSSLLFDFNQFHQSLIEMLVPKEINIELLAGGNKFILRSHEINDCGLYFQSEIVFAKGTFGILKFSLISDDQIQNFVLPGFIEDQSSEGTLFRINKSYLTNWKRFLIFLENKQVKINRFLKKAAGF